MHYISKTVALFHSAQGCSLGLERLGLEAVSSRAVAKGVLRVRAEHPLVDLAAPVLNLRLSTPC